MPDMARRCKHCVLLKWRLQPATLTKKTTLSAGNKITAIENLGATEVGTLVR